MPRLSGAFSRPSLPGPGELADSTTKKRWWRSTLLAVGALAGFSLGSCSGIQSTPHPNCDVPVEIDSTVSILGSSTPRAEGVLTFRGIDYQIWITDWPSEQLDYKGNGHICNLAIPNEVSGRYAMKSAEVWGNDSGVEIHIMPPIYSSGTPRPLNVAFSGAILPRQP